MENHRIVGYTSIRIKPNRDHVKEADEVYRTIKTGNAVFDIREGIAVRRSPLRQLSGLCERFAYQ